VTALTSDQPDFSVGVVFASFGVVSWTKMLSPFGGFCSNQSESLICCIKFAHISCSASPEDSSPLFMDRRTTYRLFTDKCGVVIDALAVAPAAILCTIVCPSHDIRLLLHCNHHHHHHGWQSLCPHSGCAASTSAMHLAMTQRMRILPRFSNIIFIYPSTLVHGK
jgi:hypothetical protein